MEFKKVRRACEKCHFIKTDCVKTLIKLFDVEYDGIFHKKDDIKVPSSCPYILEMIVEEE